MLQGFFQAGSTEIHHWLMMCLGIKAFTGPGYGTVYSTCVWMQNSKCVRETVYVHTHM